MKSLLIFFVTAKIPKQKQHEDDIFVVTLLQKPIGLNFIGVDLSLLSSLHKEWFQELVQESYRHALKWKLELYFSCYFHYHANVVNLFQSLAS